MFASGGLHLASDVRAIEASLELDFRAVKKVLHDEMVSYELTRVRQGFLRGRKVAGLFLPSQVCGLD